MSARRRFLHPLWLIASVPGYIGWRLIPALTHETLGLVYGELLLAAAAVLVPYSINTRAVANRRFADRVAWVGLTLMGFLSSLFVMTLLRDLVLAAVWVIDRPDWAFLRERSAWWTVALTALFSVIGFAIARRPRRLDVDLPIVGLPLALQGFSIAQISDLHVGPTIKRAFVERIVERVNLLHADLIAITGDLVDGTVHDLATHTAPLADLTAPHGVFFVTGNHEYYSGERSWTAEIRRLGMTVLKNQHVVLTHQGAAVVLAGINDYTAHHFESAERSDPVQAMKGAPADAALRILLAHQPSSAPAAAAAGFDVQLSGHTHGGQFWPWNLFVGYFQPFTSGINRLKHMLVYVSRGTGYWGPPNRFGVPAEITRLRLVAV